MNSLQKRAIARLAYEEISAVVEKWESLGNYNYIPLNCHWPKKITVDDEEFYQFMLGLNEK